MLLSTHFEHTSLLTTLHQSCEHSLMHCVSASLSATINGVQCSVLSTYSTVEICQKTLQLSSQLSVILLAFKVRKRPC